MYDPTGKSQASRWINGLYSRQKRSFIGMEPSIMSKSQNLCIVKSKKTIASLRTREGMETIKDNKHKKGKTSVQCI